MRTIITSQTDSLTIGALSRLTGVHIETIRYYERVKILPKPPRTVGGRRSYDPTHVRMLGFVRATFYGGPLLAQVVLELVFGRFGPTVTVAAISLICLAAALLALLFRRSFAPVE